MQLLKGVQRENVTKRNVIWDSRKCIYEGDRTANIIILVSVENCVRNAILLDVSKQCKPLVSTVHTVTSSKLFDPMVHENTPFLSATWSVVHKLGCVGHGTSHQQLHMRLLQTKPVYSLSNTFHNQDEFRTGDRTT